MTHAWRLVAGLFVFLVVAAACGGGEEVGEAFEEFEGGQQTGERLGEIRATPTSTPEPTPPPEEGPTPPPEEPEPQPEEEQEQAPAAVVEIGAGGFDPQVVRMFVGAKLRVKNVDSEPRTYTDTNRSFDSGMIPPGGTWDFVPQQPGRFDVEDKTRPYVVGTLEVVAR